MRQGGNLVVCTLAHTNVSADCAFRRLDVFAVCKVVRNACKKRCIACVESGCRKEVGHRDIECRVVCKLIVKCVFNAVVVHEFVGHFAGEFAGGNTVFGLVVGKIRVDASCFDSAGKLDFDTCLFTCDGVVVSIRAGDTACREHDVFCGCVCAVEFCRNVCDRHVVTDDDV